MIYSLFLSCDGKEDFAKKLEDIYGLPPNSTLARDIYDALLEQAQNLE